MVAIRVETPHWLRSAPEAGATLAVQVRHRGKALPVEVADRTTEGITLRFMNPESAASPGQSAVFFDGEVVVGGGRIEAVERPSAVTA